MGLSESSMSTIVAEVSLAIGKMNKEFIFFAKNQEETRATYKSFYEIAGFPTVIGTIDCTHVKILGQGGEFGEIYRNRKQFFSINVQSVAGADLKFQDIVARWPGSAHDSNIFNQSRLKERFASGEFGEGVLLGDGGYALETYLMTPFRKPVTEAEINYNKIHAITRNTVERKYGVWKRRFPCLALGLRCKLDTILTVIVACAVLHNFCIMQNEQELEEDPEVEKAIEASIEAARNDIDRIQGETRNNHRQAVLKRSNFVSKLS